MNEDNVNRALRDIDRQRRIEREKRRRQIKRQLTVVIIIMIVFFSLAGAAGYILFIKPAIEKGRTEEFLRMLQNRTAIRPVLLRMRPSMQMNPSRPSWIWLQKRQLHLKSEILISR